MWFRFSLIIIFINKGNDPNYFNFLLKVLLPSKFIAKEHLSTPKMATEKTKPLEIWPKQITHHFAKQALWDSRARPQNR